MIIYFNRLTPHGYRQSFIKMTTDLTHISKLLVKIHKIFSQHLKYFGLEVFGQNLESFSQHLKGFVQYMKQLAAYRSPPRVPVAITRTGFSKIIVKR